MSMSKKNDAVALAIGKAVLAAQAGAGSSGPAKPKKAPKGHAVAYDKLDVLVKGAVDNKRTVNKDLKESALAAGKIAGLTDKAAKKCASQLVSSANTGVSAIHGLICKIDNVANRTKHQEELIEKHSEVMRVGLELRRSKIEKGM